MDHAQVHWLYACDVGYRDLSFSSFVSEIDDTVSTVGEHRLSKNRYCQ